MKAFRVVVRALAVLALLTGAVDVLIGLPGQQKIGAALAEGYTDPLLNSQLRYLGAVWFGFGVLLWHCLGDLPKYASIVRGAFIIVFIGGLGRVASVFQFGFPPSDLGRNFVILATAIEIVGMPVLLVWMRSLLPRTT
ncbi:DUF4345 domain-containing protein [Nevskia ramosa]|uniref:DUF4345 domain-containing protein n=1 Tax=Nevskia ramosa TaxID=64002 RepID=UPI0012EB541D|nr:DUF4345 domain-containing protein [Nevskia ramosa]